MRIHSLLGHLCGAASMPLVAVTTWGAEPATKEQQHLGVASCASSMCHGKLQAAPGRDVALHEYRIWTQDDRHSRGYRTLQREKSQNIARALRLPDAATAKICLDCHAENVAPTLRGPKFQLSDGVGCEACHGGAEQWIESHTSQSSKHEDNLAKGLYPLEEPLARAELCLSCHLGTQDRFATHRIMAAGHPRLSFDLESFTERQTAALHRRCRLRASQRQGPARCAVARRPAPRCPRGTAVAAGPGSERPSRRLCHCRTIVRRPGRPELRDRGLRGQEDGTRCPVQIDRSHRQLQSAAVRGDGKNCAREVLNL